MQVKFLGTAPYYDRGTFLDEKHSFKKWIHGETKEVSEVEAHYLLENFPKLFRILETEKVFATENKMLNVSGMEKKNLEKKK